MLTQETIQHAKNLDFPGYLKSSGLDLVPTNGGSAYKALCPFHPDKNPSLSVTLKQDGWLWHCFGCDAGGDAIEFVKKREGLGFREAVGRLLPGAMPEQSRNGKTGGVPPTLPPGRGDGEESIPLPERKRLLTALTEHFHQILLNESKGQVADKVYLQGRYYLEKRGLLDEELIQTFKIGFSDGTLNKALEQNKVPGLKYEERSVLRSELGIFKPNYVETFASALVFPILDAEGNTTELYGRRVIHYEGRATNHNLTKGEHIGVWNLQGIQDADTVILTEGILDALSIYKAGFKNVTALYGAGGYTPAHHALLKNKKRVIFALDNDEPGALAVQRLAERLSGPELSSVLFPAEHKDANGVLVSQGLEALQYLLSQAKPISQTASPLESVTLQASPEPSKQEPSKPVLPSHVIPAEAGIQSSGPDLIHQGEGLRFEVRGALALRNLSFLKLVVRVHKEDKTHTDRVDFYSARSRKTFTATLCERFDVQENAIENDLLKITEQIEAQHRTRQAPKTQAPVHSMAEEEQKTALSLLKSKDLIKRIIEDLSALGYVGEDPNKLLLYLCATSRKLSRPMSVLIRSQSASGKSYLMDLICSVLPTEDVLQLTGLTPKALYYMAPDALKHKFLAVDEKDGMVDAEYTLRSLQSGGKLILAVPTKNPITNQIETTKIEREGPIAYVDGSTDTRVNPENANRCFEIYLDESAAQTLRVQEQQKKAHTLEALQNKAFKDEIRRRHQDAQRLLKSVFVVIPFAHLIQFPADWIRTRRDHDRFLMLIVSIAFLHQYQRERKEQGGRAYIEATVQDYALAHKLAKAILWNTLGEMDKATSDFYRDLESMVEVGAKQDKVTLEEYTFTRRFARKVTKLPDYLVKRHMRTLSDLEYLNLTPGPRGSRFTYTLAQPKSPKQELQGLTTPEELKAKLSVAGSYDEGAKK